MIRWIDMAGASLIALFRYLLMLLGLLYLSIKVVWTDRDLGQRDFLRQVLLQIYFTGVQAAGQVVVLGIAVGAFTVVEGIGGIGTISGAESLGRLVTVVVLRDVAPLLTGGVVIVRSITAITAEIGVMRVQREIEALEVMGVSPVRYLVTPRIFGGFFSLFVLNVLFNVAALVSGLIVGWLMVSIPADLFLRAVVSALSPTDLVAFSLKLMVGGLGIFLISCYHGMSVGSSPAEVPMAVSKASLNALVFLVVLHAIVSLGSVLHMGPARLLGEVL